MLLQLSTFTGQHAPFYLQSKGLHAGRALRQPIANCFTVHCDHPHAFAVACAAYLSGAYRMHIRGTSIPFLPITAAHDVLSASLLAATPDRFPLLHQLAQVDELHTVTLRRVAVVARLRSTLAAQIVTLNPTHP